MKAILAVLGVIALVAVMAAAQQNPSAQQQLKITNGPGVDKLTTNSAEVFWNTTQKSGSVVHYGTSRNSLNQTAEAPWGATDHKVQITNLQPGTTYYFQVASSQGEGTGTDVKSGIGIFKTKAGSMAQTDKDDQRR